MAHDIEADKSSKHFVSRDATLKNREYTSEQLSLVKKIRACKDYYEILSINKNASVREIRNSYRKIALKLHPDKNGAPGAEEAFKTAVNAVTVLTDIRKRINYDLYKNGTDCERSTKSNRPRSYTGGFDDAEVNTDKYFNPGYGLRSRVYTRRGQQWQRKTDDIKQQQHSHIKENQNTGLLTIAEVLVSILMVILLAMMFGYYFISDLSYNLSTSEKYPKLRIYNLEAPYYVKDSYYSEYQGLFINWLDLSLEEEFVSNLRNQCYSEKCFHKCFFYVFYTFRLSIFYFINTILKFLHVLHDNDNILPVLF